MKYIVDLPDGGWDYSLYFQYLSVLRGKFPPEVFRFAIDEKNYDLMSHQSLHDAWLDSLLISEVASGERSEIRHIQIHCRFLGPYHDQFINLTYFDVSNYSITSSANLQTLPAANVGHGDLLVHEVRLEDSGDITHEMLFSRGNVVKITCANFSHRLEVIRAD